MKTAGNINPPSGSVLSVRNGCMFVDGKPFVVDYPDESIKCIEDNKLVTVFKGHIYNYWCHEEIEGYWAQVMIIKRQKHMFVARCNGQILIAPTRREAMEILTGIIYA